MEEVPTMAVVEVEVNPEVEANSKAEVETKEAALVPEADIIIMEERTEFDSAPRTTVVASQTSNKLTMKPYHCLM